MTRKSSSGLAAFTRRFEERREQPAPPPPRPRGRTKPPGVAAPRTKADAALPKVRGRSQPMAAVAGSRGAGEIVSLTVRIARGDWARLHQLAVEEGTSIQQLAIRGLSEVFQGKGLARLQAVASTYRKSK